MVQLMFPEPFIRFFVLSTSMTMRLRWQVFAAAIIFFATPSVAGPLYGSQIFASDVFETIPRLVVLASNETKAREPDTDIFALMSGKCSTLKIAGRDFGCRSVAFFNGQGRTNFTIALDDPTDDSHIISFSGENGRREGNLYELPIDRMLLNSKDRPKVDGLPVPFAEFSTGICKQLGNFATGQVSSISCIASDKHGKRYELQFESDGSPMTVRRVRQYPLTAVKRRARLTEQRECRYKADLAKVLPRDRPAYIIGCLAEYSQRLVPATDQ